MERPRTKRPRPRRWRWETILAMYRQQLSPPDVDDLEAKAREVARQLNRLEDCTRHDAWRFENHETVAGLVVVGPDDPGAHGLDHEC